MLTANSSSGPHAHRKPCGLLWPALPTPKQSLKIVMVKPWAMWNLQRPPMALSSGPAFRDYPRVLMPCTCTRPAGCEGSFDSAGGHHAPLGQGHGILDGDGVHAGDLPNIHVAESAPLQVQYMSRSLLLGDTLLDSNGAAVVLHRHADDYQSNPAGAAGPRIACGVISRIDSQGS